MFKREAFMPFCPPKSGEEPKYYKHDPLSQVCDRLNRFPTEAERFKWVRKQEINCVECPDLQNTLIRGQALQPETIGRFQKRRSRCPSVDSDELRGKQLRSKPEQRPGPDRGAGLPAALSA